jgi:type IV fimbrial biogenesis protein FimT
VRTSESGISLIEVLVVLAIAAIMIGAAAPSFRGFSERNQAAHAMNWIIRAVRFTRQAAIIHGATTTLCPSLDGEHCGGKWHDGVLIFTDRNSNRKLDQGDHRLLRLPYPYQGSTIKWRSFGNRQFLQIRSTGYTNFQNGNFVYCNATREPRYSRQVVVNLQGRVRKSYDTNNDGIVEDRNGDPLRC